MDDKENRIPDLILSWQCRAGRAALSLRTRDFARLAGISTDTLARIERGETVKASTQSRIVRVLADAGFFVEIDTARGSAIRAKA